VVEPVPLHDPAIDWELRPGGGWIKRPRPDHGTVSKGFVHVAVVAEPDGDANDSEAQRS
jgi:hypothetical protein